MLTLHIHIYSILRKVLTAHSVNGVMIMMILSGPLLELLPSSLNHLQANGQVGILESILNGVYIHSSWILDNWHRRTYTNEGLTFSCTADLLPWSQTKLSTRF